MAIVEALLGAILTVVLEKLASGELLTFLRRAGINAPLKGWGATLSTIRAVLVDAENKQTNETVKKWLNNLENLAYDLEDLVDELNTEALQRKLRENKGSTSKVKKLIPTCCTNLSFTDFMSERGIAAKLKEISDRLEDLEKQKNTLELVENVRGRSYEGLPTTSLVVKSEVYGREEDKKEILKMLFGVESNDSPKLSVIPIVGMGGIGKTTLVKLVYNDERVEEKFNLRAWVCVSEELCAVTVTKKILEAVSSGGKCDYENFDTLQTKLKDILSKTKFLVVLDDIRNEKREFWDSLRLPFLDGKPGSTIIITTRKEGVAKSMSQIPAYHPNLLSEGDALSVLAEHAFQGKTFDGHSDLIEIGKSMVRRCDCLPLAVKALGGLLSKQRGSKGWEEVFESKIWKDEEEGEILPVLKLSYIYLPPQLKRCFAYCALFPKGYQFEKSHLVYLWMAEDLLQETNGMLIEEVGSQYFDELLYGSFFQQSSVNASCFVMHDLLNDLAMSVAGEKCLRMDDAPKENLPSKISENVRHLSFKRTFYETYPRFSFPYKIQNLRTFLPLPIDIMYSHYISKRILRQLLPNSYHLRVLSLNGYEIYKLPDSIGELKHLRYLGLARTSLKWLPESVSTLINLKVLILRGCRSLTKLPTFMENLINLRHLDISGTDELLEMPRGIAQLTSLQTLTKMTASKNNGMRLKDLGNLSSLQGEISIEELQNVVNVQEAEDARLMDKPNLNKIRLAWREVYDDSPDKVFELDVFNALKSCENLSTLEIKYYGGKNFFNWIGDSAFHKLEKISFGFCKNCTTLPPLGQLRLLRDLIIQGISQVKEIGAEFYGNRGNIGELPFPSLINLTFEDMSNWEEWHGIEGVIKLPRLHKLNIRSCSKLVRLPKLLLPSLHELEATECNVVVLNHMKNLESLTHIELKKIFQLTSIIEAFVQFPFTLESLSIDECDDLLTLSKSDNIAQYLFNLQKVHVGSCPKLVSLQEIDVLPDLRTIWIVKCEALELLPNKISCLEDLSISECPSLKMMMNLKDCSTSLNYLYIADSWVNLNLANLLGSGHEYQSLTELRIISCDDVELFPHGGLRTPNLRALNISDCQRLKSLPVRMDLLSSLSYLRLSNCASLVELFPQENIPPNLSILEIKNCWKLKPLEDWGLDKLTSLESFDFGGCLELVSFAKYADDEHCLLPPSLTSLDLTDLPNLETLSKGLQSLTSLRQLNIFRCPKLKALPMEDHLKKFLSLRIECCPLLTERYLKDYWNIRDDIPEVRIDKRSIYDPCA